MSTEVEEVVDLDVNLDEPVPCSGVAWKQYGIPRQPCDREAEFKMTFRHCGKTWTRHKCALHTGMYANGFSCDFCLDVSDDMTVRPLR